VSVLGRIISGGDRTFLGVVAVLEANSFVAGRVGSPVIAITKKAGPWRVSLAQDGHRSGYYTVTVTGSKGKESLKAYWRELSDGRFEVYSIYKTELFKQDELLWGAPGKR